MHHLMEDAGRERQTQTMAQSRELVSPAFDLLSDVNAIAHTRPGRAGTPERKMMLVTGRNDDLEGVRQ
jgi:hypothetical protein